MSFLENPFEVLENIKLDFQQEIKNNESEILQIQNREREIREQERLKNLSSNVFREELKRGSENIRKINQEIETLKDELKKIESKILNEQFSLFSKVQAAKESGISTISNSIPKTANIENVLIPVEIKKPADNTLRDLLLIGGALLVL
jgi:predicted  nucleic acid-binding Zn-ribbon protein